MFKTFLFSALIISSLFSISLTQDLNLVSENDDYSLFLGEYTTGLSENNEADLDVNDNVDNSQDITAVLAGTLTNINENIQEDTNNQAGDSLKNDAERLGIIVRSNNRHFDDARHFGTVDQPNPGKLSGVLGDAYRQALANANARTNNAANQISQSIDNIPVNIPVNLENPASNPTVAISNVAAINNAVATAAAYRSAPNSASNAFNNVADNVANAANYVNDALDNVSNDAYINAANAANTANTIANGNGLEDLGARLRRSRNN